MLSLTCIKWSYQFLLKLLSSKQLWNCTISGWSRPTRCNGWTWAQRWRGRLVHHHWPSISNVCLNDLTKGFVGQGLQGPRGITGLPGPKGDAVSIISVSNTMTMLHFLLGSFYYSHQGLPGVDGREGIPGMPGSKVNFLQLRIIMIKYVLQSDLPHCLFCRQGGIGKPGLPGEGGPQGLPVSLTPKLSSAHRV